ncbi:hypothetical protein BH23THE1_BH23THE1_08390 [soil metagenome]
MVISKSEILIRKISLTIFMCWLLLAIYIALIPSFPSQAQVIDSDNRINLAISNITLGESATGLTSVNGVILNNSTMDVENIQMDVVLYDVNNNTIQDTSRFITTPFTIVKPNSTETFEFLMLTEEYDRYSAKAYAERVE